MADYSGLTVAVLKDELKKRGLPVSGRKAELVERLIANDQQGGEVEAPAEGKADEPVADAHEAGKPVNAAEDAEISVKEHAGSADGTNPAQARVDERAEQSEEDELSLGDSDEEEDTEAPASDALKSEEKQLEQKQEEVPQPAAEPQVEAEPEANEAADPPASDQPPELHSESSKGRFKPITFPGSSQSPGTAAPSSAEPPRAADQDAPKNNSNAEPPSADVKPASKTTPARREASIEVPVEASTPASDPLVTNGSGEHSGSKRKRPVIVFDPQPSAPTDSPPQKRDKVELVVEVATEVTCALRIDGLKRPLREADLKAILEETGQLMGFWIDSCKTHCYVVYATVEQAKASFEALDGREWPPRCRSIMHPKYVMPEEANGMIESRGNATLRRMDSAGADCDVIEAGAAANPGSDSGRGGRRGGERGAPIEQRVSDAATRRSTEAADARGRGASAGGPRDIRRRASSDVGEQHGSGANGDADVVDLRDEPDSREPQTVEPGEAQQDEEMVDVGGEAGSAEKEPEAPAPASLFRLTKKQPGLYWLPLGEEEVQHLREVSAAKKLSQQRSSAACSGDAEGGGGGGDTHMVDLPEGDAKAPESRHEEAMELKEDAPAAAVKESGRDEAPRAVPEVDVARNDAVEATA